MTGDFKDIIISNNRFAVVDPAKIGVEMEVTRNQDSVTIKIGKSLPEQLKSDKKDGKQVNRERHRAVKTGRARRKWMIKNITNEKKSAKRRRKPSKLVL